MKPLRIIDTEFNLLAEIDDYESMFMIRRFHGVGEIEFRINRYKQHTDKLIKGNLILVGSQLNKVFIIKHREIELTEEGKTSENWVIKGWALESIINQRVVVPLNGLTHDSISGNAETVMKHFVNNHIINPTDNNRKIEKVINADDKKRGSEIYWKSRFGNLAEETTSISLTAGLGWGVSLDILNEKWVFDVLQGRNLTVNQSALPPVIFSPQFESLNVLHYMESEFNYKNAAYVAGQGEGVDRRIVELSNDNGLNRHEIFIDARDIPEVIEKTGEEPTPRPENEIIQDITNRGLQQLGQFLQEQYLEGQILTNSPFKYEVDYDLGDVVTIQNKDWGVTLDARITEIKEIYEAETGFRLEATFGNNRPTLIQKIKQELSQISGEVRK